MKNYRLKKFIRLSEEEREEYQHIFKQSKGVSDKLGIFKCKNIELMSFEDTLILRQSLADEFKVLQMMFSIPVNIPFVSFISINTPDGKTIKTVLKKATFHIKMPKWFILRSRIQEYFLALNNCVTQVKSITKKEKTLWKFPPNSLYTQAVGNEMDSFGMTPLLKTVAEANGVKKEEVYNWTWRNVNFEISMLAAGSRVQQAYNKLLEGKNKK